MRDVEWNDEKFNRDLRALVRKKLITISTLYRRTIDALFRSPKSGRIYRVGKTPTKKDRSLGITFRSHQASAPGEAPAIDTAALAKSVTHEITETADSFNLDIGPSAQSGRDEIAGYLEFGTSKIAPRPAWRPALEAVAQQTESEIRIAAEG